MRKILTILTIFLFLGLAFPKETYAKKVLPKRSGAVSSGVATSVKFRRDRLAIIVYFANITRAQSIDYMLSYDTRGTTQGVRGGLNPNTPPTSTSRELLFGTCSHGVCRYDRGITNAKLVINITLANGKKIIRTYRLRV